MNADEKACRTGWSRKGSRKLAGRYFNNPGVRQPWTWKELGDRSQRRDWQEDDRRGGEGPEQRKVADVLALVPRCWWCDVSVGQEIDEFNLGLVKGLGHRQVRYMS